MKRSVLVLRVLTVLLIGFIFYHSAMPGDESFSLSERVWAAFVAFCAHFMDTSGLEQFTGVRYLAHFLEFAALGFLLLLADGLNGRLTWQGFWNICTFGVLVALCDETIQIFSPGRSARVDEIWLDAAGHLFGTGIAIITLKLIQGVSGRKSS